MFDLIIINFFMLSLNSVKESEGPVWKWWHGLLFSKGVKLDTVKDRAKRPVGQAQSGPWC